MKPGERLGALLLIAVSVAVLTAGCGGNVEQSNTEAETATSATRPPAVHTNADWATVVSDPDAYAGDRVKLVGQVFWVERDQGVVTLQVYMAKSREQNTVVTYKHSGQEIDVDDYVRITGRVKGKIEGWNLVGDRLALPAVKASSVVVVDAVEAAAPAHTTYPPASSAKGGVTMMVTKIEAARDETRVFVTVHNRSAADFSFDTSFPQLSADGVEIESLYSDDYSRPADEVPAKSKTSGVLVFEPVPQDAGLGLILTGDSDNADAGYGGWLEWIFLW